MSKYSSYWDFSKTSRKLEFTSTDQLGNAIFDIYLADFISKFRTVNKDTLHIKH